MTQALQCSARLFVSDAKVPTSSKLFSISTPILDSCDMDRKERFIYEASIISVYVFAWWRGALGTESWDSFQEASKDPIYDRTEQLTTSTVGAVTSPLGMTKSASWYARFKYGGTMYNSLTGFNTTHWGLQIDELFFDLKRTDGQGNPGGPLSRFEAATLSLRTENKILSHTLLGETHFTNREILGFGTSLGPDLDFTYRITYGKLTHLRAPSAESLYSVREPGEKLPDFRITTISSRDIMSHLPSRTGSADTWSHKRLLRFVCYSWAPRAHTLRRGWRLYLVSHTICLWLARNMLFERKLPNFVVGSCALVDSVMHS